MPRVSTVGVGDRRVVEAMRAENLQIGGEQSGHIVCGEESHFIGDGTYTALKILGVMRDEEATLSALAAPYSAFPQVLLNVQVGSKPKLSEIASIRAAVERVESELGEDGRVLLRYSGTEPLARVMVEGPDADVIQRHARDLAKVIESEIGA